MRDIVARVEEQKVKESQRHNQEPVGIARQD
jgi:hypothetical protein